MTSRSSRELQILSRRKFLQRSVGVAAALAGADFSLGAGEATSGVGPVPELALPPFLSRPTGTSIRISAFNGSLPGAITLEVRPKGASYWKVRLPGVEAGRHEKLDWNVTGLSPGTKYEYRIGLSEGSERSPRPLAVGSFRTQRIGRASYTAVLITDSHTGSFALGSGPAVTLD